MRSSNLFKLKDLLTAEWISIYACVAKLRIKDEVLL